MVLTSALLHVDYMDYIGYMGYMGYVNTPVRYLRSLRLASKEIVRPAFNAIHNCRQITHMVDVQSTGIQLRVGPY